MRRIAFIGLVGVLGVGWMASARGAEAETDAYRWLEDVTSERALAWVKQHNDATAARLTKLPGYDALYADALAVLNSKSRVPAVEAHGEYLYNLWKDEAHPRGLLRRTTLAEFRKEAPAWETVLDLDGLSKGEGKPWAFGGAIWRKPDERRCLIELSAGGGDAVELREFDVEKLAFVDGGFVVPVAKSTAAWRDADSLFIGTEFGPGTMTNSGYPRVVKLWRRGTPLSSAKTLYEAPVTSVSASAQRLGEGERAIDLVSDSVDFWTVKVARLVDGELQPLALPATARVLEAFAGRLVVRLKEDWNFGGQAFVADSVVIADPAALTGGAGKVELVVAPTATDVIDDVQVTAKGIYVTLLENVRGRLRRFTPTAGGGWRGETIAFPDNGALKFVSTNDDSGEAWVEFETFTTPPALYRVAADADTPEKLKAQAPMFDGTRFETQQLWCTSADGTKVPYFVVGPKSMKHDGTNPVWMFSYGGFENSLVPSYSGSYEDLHGAYGKLWLERGGVFVLANIRGGGEFGPAWHEGAVKEKHVHAFEDFEAVARDLVKRRITSPSHLGIEGRSNGGLLVGATMLRHPELYGAVVCGNPLLDMQRYTHLLAGASWAAEYGDPDVPGQWSYIGRYSPYQNLKAGMKLPPVMFYTTTRDDRVHPGHARKMAAKLEALGYDFEYFENTEGGHHGSVTSEQLATRLARTYAFLWEHVK